jgi:hypothetical protein
MQLSRLEVMSFLASFISAVQKKTAHVCDARLEASNAGLL